MPLADEHTGMVDGLGRAHLEELGLEAALQEVLDLEAQHVIQLHVVLVQHAAAHQATQQGVT